MKLVKITHYQNADEYEFNEYTLKEGTKEEILPVLKRYALYTLPVYEGLPLIAVSEKSFTFGSYSKFGYYVRLEVRE